MHTRRTILAVDLNPGALSIEGMAAVIVKLMREVQSSGPYAILGHSFGGNIAVEVARQLIANDQTVELVAVIDSYVPSFVPKGLSKAVMHLRIIAKLTLREIYAYVSSRVQRKLFPRLPKAENGRIAEISNERIRLLKERIRLLDAHRPQVFPGRIVLVRATDILSPGGIRIADPSGTNGWSCICKGGVDVIPMACAHADFFNEPYTTALAGHVDALLDAIDR